jgi:hypothetical protein
LIFLLSIALRVLVLMQFAVIPAYEQ